MDVRELAEDLGLEEEEFIQLVDLFLETSLSDLSRLRFGLRQGDPERVAEAAHSIKGASGNLGFHEIHELVKGVEIKAKANCLDGLIEAAGAISAELDQVSKSFRTG